VLYWFRTPPGVKVGRAALDDDAIRRIEKLNPGITFDWPRILKGQGTPATESRPPLDVRRQRPDNRRPMPPQAPVPAGAAQALEEALSSELAETDIARETPGAQSDDVLSATEAIPEEIEETQEISAPPAALAKLGAEGIQRLRARYSDILVRITERTADPERREELKWQADRLNPDSWVTPEDVAQALEQYETVLASLGDVIGQRRRRKRRGGRQRPAESDGSRREMAGTGESVTGRQDAAEPAAVEQMTAAEPAGESGDAMEPSDDDDDPDGGDSDG
jgi:hypothetical protein